MLRTLESSVEFVPRPRQWVSYKTGENAAFLSRRRQKFTRPLKSIKFEKDEPICTIIPARRHEVESFDPEVVNASGDVLTEYEAWLESRIQHVERKQAGASAKAMEPHYMRGETVTGKRFDSHQNKLDLKEFVEKDQPNPSKVEYRPASTPAKGVLKKLFGR